MSDIPDPTSPVAVSYEALRSTAAALVLARDVLVVRGPDAASYLQGQCSQDVDGMAVGATLDALLLSPQGKVDALIRVTRTGAEEFVLDTDVGYGDVVDARLKRFRLRVDVDIEPLAWSCVAVRGPESTRCVVGQPQLTLPVAWPGLSGVDLLGPTPPEGAISWVSDQTVRCDAGAWEAARIESGIPVNGREILDGTIAAEVGLVDRAVSFTKGCFTGQELVARLNSRGSKVARRLCGVILASGAGVDERDEGVRTAGAGLGGASVFTADGEHEVGHLTSVAWSPRSEGIVALATLHRRVTPPEPVSVRWSDGGVEHEAIAEARPLPMFSRT
jgi:folate-binding protein YgfZ